MDLTEIPCDAIKDHLSPFLNDMCIVALASTNHFFHDIFVKNVNENENMNIFANRLWRERCISRWKNIKFTAFSSTSMGSSVRKNASSWLEEYKKRHCDDKETRMLLRALDGLCKRKVSKPYEFGRSDAFREMNDILIDLIHRGDDILDVLHECSRITCKSTADNYEGGTRTSNREDYDDNHQQEQGYVFAPDVIEKLRRATVLNNVYKELQRVMKDDSNDPLEYGALLITRYHSIDHDIVVDEDTGVVSSCIETYVERELDGLASLLLSRLRARHVNNDPATGDSSSSTSTNANTNAYPVRIVLEEMKYLFAKWEDVPEHEMNGFGDDPIAEMISSTSTSTSPSTLQPVNASPPFIGNRVNYYSVSNSMTHHILKRRCGIPLTLAVMYAAIVRRATGIELNPMGLPGHFMLSATIPGKEQIFVDAFDGGAMRSLSDVKTMLETSFGFTWNDNESYCQPISKEFVWLRMLRNLANCLDIDFTKTEFRLLFQLAKDLDSEYVLAFCEFFWRTNNE